MKKIWGFTMVLLAASCIGMHVHVLADSTPYENEVKRINQITDTMRLQTMLKSTYDRYDKDVLQIRLLLLEPEIVAYYGDLQFTYSFSKVKDKTYTMGGWQPCTLYVEHISVKIIDATEKIVQQFRFSGLPGGSQETFETFNGMCSSKTNEATVNVDEIREYLYRPLPPPPPPSPIDSNYEVQILHDKYVVIDHRNRLMWQQAGSPTMMIWKDTKDYIASLNQEQFAGYSNWRLPTIEELQSLLKSIENDQGLYLDPVFGSMQKYCWAIDKDSSNAWRVNFLINNTTSTQTESTFYVRAVRSL